jgi:putative membrane protein
VTITAALILVAAVYARGWNQRPPAEARAPAHDIDLWRLAAFLSGLCVLWIVVASPLAMLHHVSLTIHMTQHLLLMTVAAPLILIGAPARALLRGLPARVARARDAAVCTGFVRRLGRVLTHPACCWLAATGVVLGWHVPAAFAWAMRSHAWHDVQQASFFAAGLLFWWPVVQPASSVTTWPAWSVPAYLFAATLPCDALSAFLVFCDRVVYASYLSGPSLFQMSPLQDQACAGALMWVSVTLIYLIPAVIVTMRLLSPAHVLSATGI